MRREDLRVVTLQVLLQGFPQTFEQVAAHMRATVATPHHGATLCCASLLGLGRESPDVGPKHPRDGTVGPICWGDVVAGPAVTELL